MVSRRQQYHKKIKKKKITFFNLGPKNDWRKILNEDSKEKIYKIFKNEIDELYNNQIACF